MSPIEAVQNCFSNYASFQGRARRSEYWYFALCIFVGEVILNVIAGILAKATGTNIFSILPTIWGLATLIPSIAVTVRRLHDLGKSGAWYLLNFVPVVGGIVIFIFMCLDSKPGANEYGPNPKGY